MTSLYPEFAGNPHEAEMIELYDKLNRLAGTWRGTQPSDSTDAPLHLEIVQQYHEVFNKLVELGWDWRFIDVEAMLPDGLMPDIYYQTLSVDQLMGTLLMYVRWWHMKIARPGLSIHGFDRAYARLLELGSDPEQILKRQNERESNVIWYGIPLSPEKFYERHPQLKPNSSR